MDKGYLALVLHTHLPYVHHPESEKVMEERWLFEAITECYVPLLQVFDGLERDGVPFRMTLSLTPTLLTMLASPLLQERALCHLDQQILLAEKETKRLAGDKRFGRLARYYRDRFREIRRLYEGEYGCDLIARFRRHQESGRLELITSSATHAFLPYVKTEQAIRAQIENAVSIHTECLGRPPQGIWLPECGYADGLDRVLDDCGLRYFFTDSHALDHAYPKPARGRFAPIRTSGGPLAFARDQDASSQVWSSVHGYPGDADYREFYRDIAFEREDDYMAPHLHASGIRLDSGLKYYRITGAGEHKEPYVPEWAAGKTAGHARHFADRIEARLAEAPAGFDRTPLLLASYDTELFGHWWYEGPQWLDGLCRELAGRDIRLTAPSEYVKEYPEAQEAHLSFASWGRSGYGEVWLNEANGWMYRELHQAEEEMIRLADAFPRAAGLQRRALDQAVRELLLAQSSDWAFIMDGGTVVDYAVNRFRGHIGRFRHLADAVRRDAVDERWLAEVERRDAMAPFADYRTYRTPAAPDGYSAEQTEPRADVIAEPIAEAEGVGEEGPTDREREVVSLLRKRQNGRPLKVLLLAWEFPPMVVGGLSRHVFELSRKLRALGHEVHVLTTHVKGYPAYERNDGVHVHRVETFQARELDFMGWVFQLNLRMVDYGGMLLSDYGPFDLIHAHDWLVGHAAGALKHRFGLPLVATIHATEHGRNQGLHSDLQRRIHSLEWELTYEAAGVIGCSRYMERELQSLFKLPPGKIAVIPNGIEPASLRPVGDIEAERSRYALPEERVVLFVGRLVREKGVHVLLESMPSVLASCPNTRLVIGGKGPMLEELKRRAYQLGVGERVTFPGFIDDLARDRLLAGCSVAVFPSLYEPFGIVALEAMAAGAPVIVSGTGGLQEIVEYGTDGYTVLPGNVQSLAEHLIRMLQDETAAQRMARRAYEKVCEQYDWTRIAEQTAAVYRRYAEEASGPAARAANEVGV